jgi:hypothetical protein
VKPPFGPDVEPFAPSWWSPSSGPLFSLELPPPPHDSGALSDDFVERRVATLLAASSRFRAGVTLEDLRDLLPQEGPRDVPSLDRWLAARPALARREGRFVLPPTAVPSDLNGRAQRAASFRTVAERLVAVDLVALMPWVRCVAVTGSTAYGTPAAEDDLDFFIVTRAGAMWLFLLFAALRLRARRSAGRSDPGPRPCLNFVLDERSVDSEFRTRRGFLFAREALTALVLRGDEYYRSVLRDAPWIGEEIPRSYAARSAGPSVERPRRVPRVVRMVNAALFPPLAAYLHLIGLYRNHRLRRWGRSSDRFRTVVGFRRLANPTDRYDALSEALESASRRPVPVPPLESGPRPRATP